MPQLILGIGSIFTGVMGMKSAKKQAQAERKAQEIEQRRANALAQKEKYQQVREARINRARVMSSAATAGLTGAGTSGAQGGWGSVQSQMGENIGTINQMQGFSNAVSQQNMIASRQASKSQMWAGIGNMFSQASSAAAGMPVGSSTTPFSQPKVQSTTGSTSRPWGTTGGWGNY
jgi:hypothetical protein